MRTSKHELFPQEGEEPATVVETIQVFRVEGIGSNASRPSLSTQIPCADLTNEDQIYAQWGPGTYELWARCENRITRRRTICLPPKQGAPPPASPAPAVPAAPGAFPSGEGGMFAMLFGLMQQQQQMQQQHTEHILQLTTAFMTHSEQKNNATLALLSENSKTQVGVMGEFFRGLSAAKSPPPLPPATDSLQAFRQGMDFFKDVAKSAAPREPAPSGENLLVSGLGAAGVLVESLAKAKAAGLFQAAPGSLIAPSATAPHVAVVHAAPASQAASTLAPTASPLAPVPNPPRLATPTPRPERPEPRPEARNLFPAQAPAPVVRLPHAAAVATPAAAPGAPVSSEQAGSALSESGGQSAVA